MAENPLTPGQWVAIIQSVIIPILGWIGWMTYRALGILHRGEGRLVKLETWSEGHEDRCADRHNGHDKRFHLVESRVGVLEHHAMNPPGGQA